MLDMSSFRSFHCLYRNPGIAALCKGTGSVVFIYMTGTPHTQDATAWAETHSRIFGLGAETINVFTSQLFLFLSLSSLAIRCETYPMQDVKVYSGTLKQALEFLQSLADPNTKLFNNDHGNTVIRTHVHAYSATLVLANLAAFKGKALDDALNAVMDHVEATTNYSGLEPFLLTCIARHPLNPSLFERARALWGRFAKFSTDAFPLFFYDEPTKQMFVLNEVSEDVFRSGRYWNQPQMLRAVIYKEPASTSLIAFSDDAPVETTFTTPSPVTKETCVLLQV